MPCSVAGAALKGVGTDTIAGFGAMIGKDAAAIVIRSP